MIKVSVRDLSAVTADGYPVQINTASTNLPSYQSNSGGKAGLYLGEIVSGIFLIIFAINYCCGSERSILITLDGIQTIHSFFYLAVWSHPLIENYMIGLKLTALRVLVGNFGVEAHLLNCDPKYFLIFGYCDLFLEIALPLFAIIVFIALAFICKYISTLERKQAFVWNHIHSIWWFAGMSMAISSFRGLSSNSTSTFVTSLVLCITFVMLAGVLSFKIV